MATKTTPPKPRPAPPAANCTAVIAELNQSLLKACRGNRVQLKPCGHQENAGCGCGGDTGPGKCKEAPLPKLHPCISVSWGERPHDCLETDDVEVLCITICNCYSNVDFENVVLSQILVKDKNGKDVALLPDGSPSVDAVPRGPFCFGDIPRCKDGRPNCVSRQFVLWTRGAKGGEYQLRLGPLCFKTSATYNENACFAFELEEDR